MNNLFENYVNYAGSKTAGSTFSFLGEFENYVNYAGSKTKPHSALKNTSLRTM